MAQQITTGLDQQRMQQTNSPIAGAYGLGQQSFDPRTAGVSTQPVQQGAYANVPQQSRQFTPQQTQFGQPQQFGTRQFSPQQFGSQQQFTPQQFGSQQFSPQQFGSQQFTPQQFGSQQFSPQPFGSQVAQSTIPNEFGTILGDVRSRQPVDVAGATQFTNGFATNPLAVQQGSTIDQFGGIDASLGTALPFQQLLGAYGNLSTVLPDAFQQLATTAYGQGIRNLNDLNALFSRNVDAFGSLASNVSPFANLGIPTNQVPFESRQSIQNGIQSPYLRSLQNLPNYQTLQNVPNLQSLQNVPNFQNLQNVPNFQGLQNVPNFQNLQDIQNLQNVPNFQNLQTVPSFQNLQGIQGFQDVQSLQNLQNVPSFQTPLNRQRFQDFSNQNLQALQGLQNPLYQGFQNLPVQSIPNQFPLQQDLATSQGGIGIPTPNVVPTSVGQIPVSSVDPTVATGANSIVDQPLLAR